MMLLSNADNPYFRKIKSHHGDLFGWFITPRKLSIPQGLKDGQIWGCDNDCYNLGESFDFAAFLAWLEKLQPYRQSCLFVPAPDVVGNHTATLDKFYKSAPEIAALGFPVAFVLQDGCENAADVPWNQIDAVFIGGTTEYKLSQAVVSLLIEAGQRGKWRHVGRVGTPKRINQFYGLADSFDGTIFGRKPDFSIRWAKNHLLWRQQQPRLIETIKELK